MTRAVSAAVRGFRFAFAFAVGLTLASLSVGPVGAYSNITETGMVGHWSLNDSLGTPGAVCSYGAEYPPDYAGFRWMNVKPPVVFAADRDSNKIDHKRVKWFWKLQRSHYPNNDWKTIDTSAIQSAMAYENQAAQFSAIRIYRNVGNPDFNDVVYRALVVIKWVKADGSVEGTAKATIDWYNRKMPWDTSVGGAPFCSQVATAG
jgi:hypothetical protein